MNKLKTVILLLAALICLAGCGGVVLDENEITEGNGTDSLVKAGAAFTYKDGVIYKENEVLASLEGASDDSLFALGEYLYANTEEGVKQIRISDGKVKKFGAGVILAAKGRWIYYKSDLSKARGMSLYKIDMIEGREVLLFEGDPTEAQNDGDSFTFITSDGKVYTNALDSDEAAEVCSGYDYGKILNGDLSDFAGVWKNADGMTLNLQSDGTEGQTVTNEDGKVCAQTAGDFAQNGDGSYTWVVCLDLGGGEGDSYGISLYPIGVEIDSYGTALETDTAKVRLCAGHDLPSDAAEVYYLQ